MLLEDVDSLLSIIYLKNGEILLKSKAVLNIGIQLNGVIIFKFTKIY